MKKRIRKLTVVGVLALFMSIGIGCNVFAAEETTELDASTSIYDYSYSTLDDGTIEITKYSGSDTVISIPSSIYGKTVTSIGKWAFWGKSELTSITIPDTVTSIGNYAFSGCSGLTSINVPDSVTSFGEYAFNGCWGLAENGLIIVRDAVFACNSDETSITLPNGITSIEDFAFYDCSHLTSIILPDSVTSIEKNAFANCYNLTSINIPEGVTVIGERAFYECKCLLDTTIPNTVTSIGDCAFYHCIGLTSINIPSSVTSIEGYAFARCDGLTSISIANNVKTIGDNAFAQCTGLTSITIPSKVTTIGYSVFLGCSSLTSVTIPNGVTSIGVDAFWGCSSLTSINIPNSMTSIGYAAFGNCSSLTSINIPDSVTNIAEYAIGMQWIGENRLEGYYSPAADFVIYCTEDSAAEEYAKTNGISYVVKGPVAAPVLKSVSNTTTGVKVSWNASEGAEKYRVYYKTGSGKWTKVADTTSTGYTVPASKLTSGTTYAFTVGCVSAEGTAVTDSYDTTGLKLMYLAPLMSADLTLSNVIAGVKVSWKSVAGAKGYIISRRPASKTTYTEIGRVTGGSTLTYTDETAVSGTKYYYNVRAYNGSTKGSYYGKSFLALGAVVKDDMTISNLSSGVKITWKQIKGAEGYYVYRKTSTETSYVKKATITDGSVVTWTDTEAVNGNSYSYRIRAYSGDTMGSYYSKTGVRLNTPSITSLTNTATARMVVEWGPNSKATGYQIRYSTDSAMPSGSYTTVTVSSASLISMTISSLTKGKTYYVKVRSYKTVGTTKYYSGWSTKKSVKISK